MSIRARKLKLIEWILRLGDEKKLSQVESILKGDQDWWDEFLEDERASIESGISQANSG